MMDRSCFWGSAPGADADAATGGEGCGAGASFWKILEVEGLDFREEKLEWRGRLALRERKLYAGSWQG
jgi:hypothetical protein